MAAQPRKPIKRTKPEDQPYRVLRQMGQNTYLVDRIPVPPSRKRNQARPKPSQASIDAMKQSIIDGRVMGVFGTVTCNGCGCCIWWAPWPRRKRGKVTAEDLNWSCWTCEPPQPDPRAPYDPHLNRPCNSCGSYLGVRYIADDRCPTCRQTSWQTTESPRPSSLAS